MYKNQYKYQKTEKGKETQKKYEQSEKGKEAIRKYLQSEKGKKVLRIRNWRKRGIISDDYDKLYEKYITTTHCELCNVELIENKYSVPNRRCLDHCHQSGLVRNIVCQSCNSRDNKLNSNSQESRDNQKKYKHNLYTYQKSWGGDVYKNINNNLLRIDVNLFLI